MARVPTLDQIKNALPILMKTTLWGTAAAALGTCSDNGLADALVEHLHELDPGTEQAKALLEIYGSVGGVSAGVANTFLAEHLGNVGEKLNYGINSDLEEALQASIAKAVPKLHEELLAYYGEELDEASRAAFKNLFERIGKVQLRGLELEKEDIDTFALRDHELFQNLFAEPYQDWDEVYFRPDSFPGNFELAIAYGLAILVQEHFHELLKDKDNRRAQIAYFIYLLEFNARTSQQNSERLERVLAALDDLAHLPEVLGTLSSDFIKARELTKKSLQSLGYQVQEAKAEILDEIRLHHQPSLYLPERSTARHYDYHYKAEYTDFVGREPELEQLRQFALTNPERRFSWWMLMGAGGSGKSRTALRLCRQLQNWNYSVGFLSTSSLENFASWENWQPSRPTLMVIDYATLHEKAVIDILVRLAQQQSRYQHPVRVLLLERDIRADWWERLTLPIEVKRSCYRGDDNPQPTDILPLPPLGDLRWDIIAQIYRCNHKPLPPDRAAILATLHGMDPLDRPLFAFFAGMALVEGENIRDWNKEDLLDNLLLREEENQWKMADHPLADKHLNLLTLATLTRGLSSSQLKIIQNNDYDWLHSPRKKEKVDGGLYSRLSGIGEEQGERVYKGLEPDLVGEYYVLRRLNQIMTADAEYGPDTVREIIQTAWATQPEAMKLMTFMTHLDFLQPHNGAYELLLKTPPHENASEETWKQWGDLWLNYTWLFEGNLCKYYYTLFNDLAGPFLDKIEPLKVKKAEALKNLAAELSGPDILPDARDLLAQFDALRPDVFPQIALQKALALFNLVARFGDQGLFSDARDLLAQFDALHPDQFPEIALQKAKALFNLINQFGDQGQLSDARDLLTQFDTLRLDVFPQIALLKAKALTNLAGRSTQPGMMADARDLLAQFDALHPDQFPEIAVEKADSLSNLAIGLSGPDMVSDARELLAHFDALHPDQFPDIAVRKAKTLSSLVSQSAKQGLLRDARALLAQFDALRPEASPQIALKKAQALTNLAGRLAGPDMMPDARALLAQFDALRPEAFPQIALQKAKALTNLTAGLSGPDVLSDAYELLAHFDALHSEQLPETALEKARTLFNIADRFAEEGLLLEAQALMTQFDTLRLNEYPEVALEKAEALFNLVIRFAKNGSLLEAHELLVHFDALQPDQFPQIALKKARALKNLILEIVRYFDTESQTRVCLQELLDLANKWPSDPLVWEQLFLSLLVIPFVNPLPKADTALRLLKINLPRLNEETEARRAENIIERCLQTIRDLKQEEATQEALMPLYLEFMVLYPFISSLEMAESKAQATEAIFMYNLEQIRNSEANREEIGENLQLCFKTLGYLSENYPQSEAIQEAYTKIEKFVETYFPGKGLKSY